VGDPDNRQVNQVQPIRRIDQKGEGGRREVGVSGIVAPRADRLAGEVTQHRHVRRQKEEGEVAPGSAEFRIHEARGDERDQSFDVQEELGSRESHFDGRRGSATRFRLQSLPSIGHLAKPLADDEEREDRGADRAQQQRPADEVFLPGGQLRQRVAAIREQNDQREIKDVSYHRGCWLT